MIRWCWPRPWGLPTEDRQLMAEDENLQLLRATRPPQQPHQREQIPGSEIHKRPEQAALPRPRQSAEPSEPSAPREPRTSLRTLRRARVDVIVAVIAALPQREYLKDGVRASKRLSWIRLL